MALGADDPQRAGGEGQGIGRNTVRAARVKARNPDPKPVRAELVEASSFFLRRPKERTALRQAQPERAIFRACRPHTSMAPPPPDTTSRSPATTHAPRSFTSARATPTPPPPPGAPGPQPP